MAEKATIKVSVQDRIGEINRHIYGHFVEHLGACTYGGIWAEDGSPAPVADGFRSDVLNLIRGVKPPNIRWPGGCFTNNYHWRDGVGPRDKRPLKFDWYWHKPEPNTFGTHEFIDLCRRTGAEPYICTNFHTGSPEESAAWVEYCNAPPNVGEGKNRAENGHPELFNVKIWSVGNETWGFSPEENANGFVKHYKAMKKADPAIETIAVGSSGHRPEWNEPLIKIAGEYFDYISIHHYTSTRPKVGEVFRDGRDEEAYLAIVGAPVYVERFLGELIQMLEALLPDRPEVGIAFDEWNVWMYSKQGLEHNYALRDAVYAAGILNALHRLSARVKIANLAQLVSCLGAIQANGETAFPTPLYSAVKLYSTLAEDVAVRTEVSCAGFDTIAINSVPALESVPYLDASATVSGDGKRAALFVANRHASEAVEGVLDLGGLTVAGKVRVDQIAGPSWSVMNTFDDPEKILPTQVEMAELPSSYSFPPHSVTVFSFGVAEN